MILAFHANDIAIYFSHKNLLTIQNTLQLYLPHLHNYFKCWELLVNPFKTHAIMFRKNINIFWSRHVLLLKLQTTLQLCHKQGQTKAFINSLIYASPLFCTLKSSFRKCKIFWPESFWSNHVPSKSQFFITCLVRTLSYRCSTLYVSFWRKLKKHRTRILQDVIKSVTSEMVKNPTIIATLRSVK